MKHASSRIYFLCTAILASLFCASAFFVAAGITAAAVKPASTSKPRSAPSLSPKPHGAEIQFVQEIQKDLTARFPTPQDAIRAGYFRYTSEDDTGAISYANLQWTSADPQHPSQLWYDVHGNLLGADFSQPHTASPPKLWGIDPRRWTHFGEHIHWVRNSNGKESYGDTNVAKFKKAGGNLASPQPETIVKLGKAANAAQVTHVFVFPNIWDLMVWIKPNPNGAFAEANPRVTPSKTAQKDDM